MNVRLLDVSAVDILTNSVSYLTDHKHWSFVIIDLTLTDTATLTEFV